MKENCISSCEGEKAKGEWRLVRTRMGGAKTQWLLLEERRKLVRPLSKKLDDQSVASGRTMKQIAADRDAEWESNRAAKKKKR